MKLSGCNYCVLKCCVVDERRCVLAVCSNLVNLSLLLAGMAPVADMRRTGMPSRGEPGGFADRGPRSFDDDDDIDIDADFGPGGFGGNVRNTRGYAGNVGAMGSRMEGVAGPMGGRMEGMASGMGDGGIMGGMMMNRVGGMVGGGMMGGIGGMAAAGGIGPGGLMGRNLDGLSRLANDMGQLGAMRGNMQGMAGADRGMRRGRDSMGRGRESMGRGRGSDGRIGRGEGPGNRLDMSVGRQRDPESGGTVVIVSNMNQQVH